MSIKGKTNADIYWHKLNGVKEITGKVTMSPEQFRKQLEQAVKFGYKKGHEDWIKSTKDMPNFRKNANSAFSIFGEDLF
jgi:hypothetical protein